jgi:peptidoglycan/LPS O-acetylase OafA/YrhL
MHETTLESYHRRDIQGLRAIAVILVVAFHINKLAPGGFLGVDIFFTISGFVITKKLMREKQKYKKINLFNFYIGRFKRLVPAVAVLITFVLVSSSLFFSPLGMQQNVVLTSLGAIFFLSNLVIDVNTGDYFASPAEKNPLLHTWSLSVEEQFYFLLPGIILIGWFIERKFKVRFALIVILTALSALSFFATLSSQELHSIYPKLSFLFGFYSPLLRFWEFSIGSIAALLSKEKSTKRGAIRKIPEMLGFFLIVISVAMLSNIEFPDYRVLLPVIGTALMLISGGQLDSLLGKVLSLKPFQFIGNRSYSIYLWHWPFIVFSESLFPFSKNAAFIAAVISIFPAIASYRYVELPIRSAVFNTRKKTRQLILATISGPLFLSVAVLAIAELYWKPIYNSPRNFKYEGDIGQVSFHEYVDENFYTCEEENLRLQAHSWENVRRCHQSHEHSSPDVVLLGDSHSEHLFLGLAEAYPKVNFAYYILFTEEGFPTAGGSNEAQAILNYVVNSNKVKVVIVTSFWKRNIPEKSIANTFQLLVSSGKNVFTTDDLPDFPFEPESCRIRLAPISPTSNCSIESDIVELQYDSYMQGVHSALTEVPKVQLLKTFNYFCSRNVCSMTNGSKLLFRDSHHLNINGSRFVANLIKSNNKNFDFALNNLN